MRVSLTLDKSQLPAAAAGTGTAAVSGVSASACLSDAASVCLLSPFLCLLAPNTAWHQSSGVRSSRETGHRWLESTCLSCTTRSTGTPSPARTACKRDTLCMFVYTCCICSHGISLMYERQGSERQAGAGKTMIIHQRSTKKVRDRDSVQQLEQLLKSMCNVKLKVRKIKQHTPKVMK